MQKTWNAGAPATRLISRGFTLLELLVVMVIIGLLAGFVAPKYFSQIGKSEVKVARAQIDALGKALDQYPVLQPPPVKDLCFDVSGFNESTNLFSHIDTF